MVNKDIFFAKKAKWTLVLLLVSATAIASIIYQSQQPHYRKVQEYVPHISKVHIIGEVVDSWCYASQTMGPGQGPGHLACATACIAGGVTPGILEDGTKILYVAAKGKGYEGSKDLLMPFIGKKVLVDGWVGDLGGSRILKIGKVAAFDPPAAKNQLRE
jgi:hypothetical protein